VLAAPLSGCTGDNEPGTAAAPDSTVTPAPTTATPEGDAALAAGALGEEQALLDFCTRAAREGARRQRAALQAVRDRQRAIVGALTDAMTDPKATSQPPIAVPRRRRAMLHELTASLAAAEEARLTDCLAAESGPFARLLASVSASHAVAVEQVRALR
jgi:hypothetical protein